jgi:hypothetical protein
MFQSQFIVKILFAFSNDTFDLCFYAMQKSDFSLKGYRISVFLDLMAKALKINTIQKTFLAMVLLLDGYYIVDI